jgi:hypothetical protein
MPQAHSTGRKNIHNHPADNTDHSDDKQDAEHYIHDFFAYAIS